MKVLILGANGKVGSRVAETLLARGHEVVAGVHKNKEHVPKGAVVTALDITSQASIERNLQGCDAVVCALSSWHAPDHSVLSRAMRVVIPAMERAHVRRIVSISGDVAQAPHEKMNVFVRLFHTLSFGVIRQVVQDSEEHIRQLHESDLDWTVLRPGIMTRSSRSSYQLYAAHPRSLFVSRRAVVAAIADQLETPTHVRQAPFVANR